MITDLKNEALLHQAEILGMTNANTIILTEAVRLTEIGLNHDSAILRDASKQLEAKINDLQHQHK